MRPECSIYFRCSGVFYGFFFLDSQLCTTGKARDFSTSTVDINYCLGDSFGQVTVIKSRYKILSCSISQILIYSHLCFKPQDLAVEALYSHLYFFFPYRKINCKFYSFGRMIRILQWMLCPTGYPARNVEGEVGVGGRTKKDGVGEKIRFFFFWGGLWHRKDATGDRLFGIMSATVQKNWENLWKWYNGDSVTWF